MANEINICPCEAFIRELTKVDLVTTELIFKCNMLIIIVGRTIDNNKFVKDGGEKVKKEDA